MFAAASFPGRVNSSTENRTVTWTTARAVRRQRSRRQEPGAARIDKAQGRPSRASMSHAPRSAPEFPCPTAWPTKPVLICCSTRTIRSTGIRGDPRRSSRAKAEQKPIFLSIGYSACHWCHVMEHESFENPEIAAAAQRAIRQHQGRSRGAARLGPDLHDCGADPHRARRLADVGLSDARTWNRFTAAPIGRPTARMGMPGFDQVLRGRGRRLARSPRAGRRRRRANWPDNLAAAGWPAAKGQAVGAIVATAATALEREFRPAAWRIRRSAEISAPVGPAAAVALLAALGPPGDA